MSWAVNETTHWNLCVYGCVWVSFCHCLTELSAVGVLCSEDTSGMKQSSSVLQSVSAGPGLIGCSSALWWGVCIQRGTVKIDKGM